MVMVPVPASYPYIEPCQKVGAKARSRLIMSSFNALSGMQSSGIFREHPLKTRGPGLCEHPWEVCLRARCQEFSLIWVDQIDQRVVECNCSHHEQRKKRLRVLVQQYTLTPLRGTNGSAQGAWAGILLMCTAVCLLLVRARVDAVRSRHTVQQEFRNKQLEESALYQTQTSRDLWTQNKIA